MPQGIECSDTIVGGRVELRVLKTESSDPATATVFYGHGDARIQPQGVERTSGVTNNGKMFITVAPRVARCVMDFVNSSKADIWSLIRPQNNDCRINVTVREVDRGITHFFNKAVVAGFGEFNLASGLITGLEFVTDPENYLRDPEIEQL